MKRLIIALSLALGLSAAAAEKVAIATLTAATPANVLSGGKYLIKSITVVNGNSTNNGRVFAYDAATAITNVVRSAYVSYATVSSNWVTVFTNASGLVITNTFTGLATVGTENAAVTNERPKIATILVPAGDIVTRQTRIAPNLGLTLFSTVAADVEIVYDEN